MTKCKAYYRYKGNVPPRCNNGNPCEGCTKKYEAKQRAKAEKLIIQPCADCRTTEKGYDSVRCIKCYYTEQNRKSDRMSEVFPEYRRYLTEHGKRLGTAIGATRR